MFALIYLIVIIAIASPVITFILVSKYAREIKAELFKIKAAISEIKSPLKKEEKETEDLGLFFSTKEKKETPIARIKRALPSTNVSAPVRAKQETTIPTQQTKTKTQPNNEPVVSKKISWEERLGTNWLNKIGIAIFVLGIGFLVKYSFNFLAAENIGNIALGVLSAAALQFFAHRLRKMHAFSSVLSGGAVVTLYFTVGVAFRDYGMVSQTTAFVLMIGITTLSILLSLFYDRKELAIISLLGGFATPLLVSTGEGNYITLFSYFLVLNAGMMILAYFKNWRIINLIAYSLTVIFYMQWLLTGFNPQVFSEARNMFIFAALFFLLFNLQNTLYNLKHGSAFIAQQFIILISASGLFFSAGIYILKDAGMDHLHGLFTVSMCLIHLGLSTFTYFNKKLSNHLLYFHLGAALVFLSLIAPIQLEGYSITLFWAAEIVLLFWLGKKTEMKLISNSVIVLGAVTLASLCGDWLSAYVFGETHLPILSNSYFITGAFTTFAFGALWYIVNNETTERLSFFLNAKRTTMLAVFKTVTLILAYISVTLELSHQLNFYVQNDAIVSIYLTLYHFILGFLLIRSKKLTINPSIVLVFSILALIWYLFPFQNQLASLRNEYLESMSIEVLQGTFHFEFLLHYLCIPFLIFFGDKILGQVKTIQGIASQEFKFFRWIMLILFVIGISQEANHIALFSSFDPDISIHANLASMQKFIYPILWGSLAFLIMRHGLIRKDRTLRIMSLVLFLVILGKLFLFDLRGISEAGKIISFIGLGLLLLVISFMYQKLKDLIFSTGDDAI